VRYTSEIIAVGPAPIATASQLEQIIGLIRQGIRTVA
jgi:hypothetical protein